MIKLLVSDVMKCYCVSLNGAGIVAALLRHQGIDVWVDRYNRAHVPPAGGR